MTFIVDASFAHAQITPAALAKIGAAGAILYAGCDDTSKNTSKAELHALLDAGFAVGLVIENGAQDMAGGRSIGRQLGAAIVTAAKQLGYDWENSVLYTSADWDTRGATLEQVDAAMAGFGEHVPHPGLYGNSYALDHCTTTGHAEFRWQSDSTSFSNGPSRHAHLLQRYNDPRAGALRSAVDVNDIATTPLGLMGETMPLDADVKARFDQVDKEIADLKAFVKTIFTAPDGTQYGEYTLDRRALAATEAAIAAVSAEVQKLAAGGSGSGGGIDPAAVTAAVEAGMKKAFAAAAGS